MKPRQKKAARSHGARHVWTRIWARVGAKKMPAVLMAVFTLVGTMGSGMAKVESGAASAYNTFHQFWSPKCDGCREVDHFAHALGKSYLETNAPNPDAALVNQDSAHLDVYASELKFPAEPFKLLKGDVENATPKTIAHSLDAFDAPFQKDPATEAAFQLGWQLVIYPAGDRVSGIQPGQYEALRQRVNAELKALSVRVTLPTITNQQQLKQQFETIESKLQKAGLA